VGLITACGEFFSELLHVSYAKVVWVFVLFSLLVSNQGLNELIRVSVPVLVGLYPLAIVLVVLALADRLWRSAARVFRPVMAVTLLFGVVDGLSAAGFAALIPAFFSQLPWASLGMGWVLPVLVTLVLAVVGDRLLSERVSNPI